MTVTCSSLQVSQLQELLRTATSLKTLITHHNSETPPTQVVALSGSCIDTWTTLPSVPRKPCFSSTTRGQLKVATRLVSPYCGANTSISNRFSMESKHRFSNPCTHTFGSTVLTACIQCGDGAQLLDVGSPRTGQRGTCRIRW